jgi:hypothetical protein
MIGAGGVSGATLPSRRVLRDWMAFHFAGRCVLDACNGGIQSYCDVNGSIGGSYLWDWDGMMLDLECVGDPLAARVGHKNSNAMIVICGMQ